MASNNLVALFEEIRRTLMQRSPSLAESVSQPAPSAELAAWRNAVGGELPAEIEELYAAYGGSSDRSKVRFTLIGNWRILPPPEAIEAFNFLRPAFERWGTTNQLVPFARDGSASYRAVAAGRAGSWQTLEDTPPLYESDQSIAVLLTRTLQALTGQDPEWRAETSAEALWWINLEAEQDDMEWEL